MTVALAVVMLNAVALSLAVLGALGAALAAWQLLGWALLGTVPVVADAWRHAGIAGDLLVAFFAVLPFLLGAALLFQAAVAWLGVALLWRRPWARRAALALAVAWAVLAPLAFAVVRYALADLARGYPEQAGFARGAAALAAEATLLNVVVAAALAWFLVQPAVRAQFTAGR